ncbi:MAG: hypothetical protein JRI23_12155 [Deltaproteobacteria bacterium]|jgi:hypothetical protein|nr:hypothetical protein [Deltaproteobacteria bacterium]MBW2532464.1 hypothetical protein [Deltaproteobacteria bacterium]
MDKHTIPLALTLISGLCLAACDEGDDDDRDDTGGDADTDSDADGDGDADGDADSDADADGDTDTSSLDPDWLAICQLHKECANFDDNYTDLADCVEKMIEQNGFEVGKPCREKCASKAQCYNAVMCLTNCFDDALREYCPGYSGGEMCCVVELPAGYCKSLIENGNCECGGHCEWDAVDCA